MGEWVSICRWMGWPPRMACSVFAGHRVRIRMLLMRQVLRGKWGCNKHCFKWTGRFFSLAGVSLSLGTKDQPVLLLPLMIQNSKKAGRNKYSLIWQGSRGDSSLSMPPLVPQPKDKAELGTIFIYYIAILSTSGFQNCCSWGCHLFKYRVQACLLYMVQLFLEAAFKSKY